MFERMLDKGREPTLPEINATLGEAGAARLRALEDRLQSEYALTKALRFPFGNHYGWGYKYGHKTAHLCYAFFETGAFTVTVQIGDRQAPGLTGLSPKAQALWADRYPCGETGGLSTKSISPSEIFLRNLSSDGNGAGFLKFLRKFPGGIRTLKRFLVVLAGSSL